MFTLNTHLFSISVYILLRIQSDTKITGLFTGFNPAPITMPKATNKFPYEFRVFEGMGYLQSQLFRNDEGKLGFIAGLDFKGRVLETISATEDRWSLDLCYAYASYIMIDVIDHGEYIYINWKEVPQTIMETLLNIQFVPTDFVSQIHGDTEYPTSHGVMF